MCKSKKDEFAGKLKMALTKLDSSKESIKRMNTGSKKLDEILKRQKTDKSKSEIGYNKGKSVFV